MRNSRALALLFLLSAAGSLLAEETAAVPVPGDSPSQTPIPADRPVASVQEVGVPAPKTPEADDGHSKFIDPKDGWFDMSEFLETAYGFIPIVSPITEPAIGYGASLGLVFLDKNPPGPDGKPRAPDMGGVTVLGTENGTWGVGGAYMLHSDDNKWQTTLGGLYASVNLDFYGIGSGPLNSGSVGYNMKAAGGMIEERYRIGQSPFSVGVRYMFANTRVEFENGYLPPQVTSPELNSNQSGLTPMLVYDSRDNVFTPTRGWFLEADLGVFAKALGGDEDYQSVALTGIYYVPLSSTVFLGLRADANFSFNDMPFYLRPAVYLRGAPARKYMGESMTQGEMELRWQFTRRFSVVGFGGAGIAWADTERFERDVSVYTGGFGFRYLLARKFGLHMGVDVAFSRDTTAFYIQFGSGWFRP